jgi:hypothetical protein
VERGMADQNQLMMINPFEAIEAGRKRAYAGYEAGQAAAQREALNELYALATDPRTGQVNMNALYSGLAQRRMGSIIPGMQQAQADIAFKQGQAAKQIEEADKIFWDGARNQLATIPDNDQLAYRTWASRVVQRAPWAAQYLPETLTKDSKRQLLMTADAALPKGVEVQRGGGTGFYDPYTGSQIGATIENIPKPEAVIRQEERVARAGAPPSPSKKFTETFGANIATQFDNLYTQAQSAESSLDLSRRLQPLLNNPKFISGTLGNVRLEIAKALGLPGAEETQAYFAGIGGQVAQIIKSFGAGTGLSDADRKFAERMAGGSEELTVEAIKKIVRLNNEASKFVINRYNKRRSELGKEEPKLPDYYPEIRAIVREGTADGRRVVEYSDGTIEYAD